MPTLNQSLSAIEAKYGPAVMRAFRSAINDITSSVTVSRVTAAITNGDLVRAVELLNIDNGAFSALQSELVAAYNESATISTAATKFRYPDGTRSVIRWDVGNEEAAAYARTTSAQRITALSDDLKATARNVIQQGLTEGQGPNKIALDLVGRTQINGTRSGGFIGLNGPQERAVQGMRARLQSGDPRQMRYLLTLERRNRNLDGIINRAIASGTPPSVADIEKVTAAYKNRLLGLRGETIARTEVQNAVARARFDATNVGLNTAGVPDWAVSKTWRHGGGGENPRSSHEGISGTTVQGLNTPFIMSDGTQLLFPHDGSLGAGAKHLANCTCYYNIDIDYAALFKAGY